jgi:hypothetical protein
MIAQPLRAAIAAASRDGLEHVRHLARIVPGPRHDLHAKQVRLSFVLAAVLQEIGTDPDLGSLRNDGARPTADERSEDLSSWAGENRFSSGSMRVCASAGAETVRPAAKATTK